ncbi:MAG: LysR family transcriptional regulator [Actinomycetota bacterium]|nr:LysR family transcriptional regulator [Acidimicrobiales bacterium]
MDIKQLEALTAVAEYGRFSTAARALNTVQSNISTHIARLENELGAILIDRSAGLLTPEGQVVLTRARRISAELEAMRDDVASMSSHVTGKVSLGIIGTTGRWLLPTLLDDLSNQYPDVEIRVIDSTTTALIPLLENGDIDLAVINTPLTHDELTTSPLFEEQLVVVTPSSHPLASDGDRTVDFHELQKHKLLLGPRGSNLRDLIDDAARRQGVNLSTLAELDGIRLAATLAFQGYAPAIVPVTAIPAWALRGDWRVLNIDSIPPRLVGLAIRRRGMLSPAANAMRDVLRTAVRFQAPSIDGLIAI